MIAENLASLARSYAGCSVSNDRARYAALVMGPGDTPASERYFCAPSTSGCALVVRGLWRAEGLRHPYLDATYRIGHAMADIVAIGRERKAWVSGQRREGRVPSPGDAVVLSSSDGGHAYTVLEVERPDGCLCELVTVDGGARDEHGQQAVALRRRVWNLDHDGQVVDRVTGPEPGMWVGRKRPVLGWVDVALV
jgi:hypothetical protein